MEVGIAQPIGGDAVECWRRNDAAEGRWRAEAHVIGDDEEDVGRALRRHHPRWPRRFGLRRIEADLSEEPGMCGSSLYGNRELSWSANSDSTCAVLARVGKARSRSR